MAFDWLTEFHHDLEKEPDYNEKALAAYRLGMRGKGSIAGIKIEPGANCCEAARNLPEGAAAAGLSSGTALRLCLSPGDELSDEEGRVGRGFAST